MKRKKLKCVSCSSTRFKQLFCCDGTFGVRCENCGALTSFQFPTSDYEPARKVVSIDTLSELCKPFQVCLDSRRGGVHE